MSPRVVVGSALACLAVTLAAAWLFQLSFERAAVLSPVIVVATGAAVAVAVLWTRVIVESLRARKHPRRIVAIALAGFALLVVLSFFVGPLPHE